MRKETTTPSMLLLLILVFLRVCSGGAGTTAPDSPLSRWLWKLKISIPDIEVTEGGYVIDLKETVCTHLSIGSVESTDKSTRASTARLNVTVDGIKLECSGLWKYRATNKMGWPKSSGKLTAKVVSSSATAALAVDGGSWPTSAHLPDCSTLITLKLDFKGSSLSSAILKLLKTAISRELSSALNAELCGWVQPLVEKNLTQVIRRGNDALTECLDTCRRRDRQMAAEKKGSGQLASNSAFTSISSSLATCAIQRLPTTLDFRNLDRHLTMNTNYGNVTLGLANVSATVAGFASSTLRFFPDKDDLFGATFDLPGWTNLTADLQIVVDEPSSSSSLVEVFSLSWPLSSLSLSSDTDLALRSIENISLGMFSKTPGACAAEAIVALNETSINATAAIFAPPRLVPKVTKGSSLESDLDNLVNVVLSAFFRAFPDLIDSYVECGVDGIVKTLLDRALLHLLNPSKSRCEASPSSSFEKDGLVHWNESKMLQTFDTLVTADALNFAATCLAGEGVHDDNHQVISHFDDFSLLSGVGGSRLQSHGTLDPLKLSLSFANSAAIQVDADSLAWLLEAQVAAVAAEWYDLTVGDFMSGDQCALQATLSSAVRFERFSINSSNVAWNISGLGDKSVPVSLLLDELFLALEEIGLDYAPQLLDFLNRHFEARHSALIRKCSSSSESSKERSNRKHLLLAIAIFIVACVAAIIFYQVLSIVFQTCRRERRSSPTNTHHSLDRRLAAPGSSSLLEETTRSPLIADDLFQEQSLFTREKERRSLATSKHIHWCARYSVPILLCFNIGLFVWSNSTPGASVDLELVLLENAAGVGPITKNLGPIFKFSLANSVRDMWKAGVYPLSVLIALCSGGWPYLKLVTMLVCWLAPWSTDRNDDDESCICLPERRVIFYLSPQKRETLLIWLDALGKWSLVDTFVMTMMLVAFHFRVKVGFDYGGGIFVDACVVNVYVIALPSFFVFVAATCLSLVLGHVILAFHRRDLQLSSSALSPATARSAVITSTPHKGCRTALFNHEFSVKEQRSVSRGRLPIYVRYGVIVSLFVALVLVCYGASEEGFDFQMRGLTGWIMGKDDANERYSIVSLGSSVGRSSKNHHGPGPIVLTVVFFAYALAFPILLLPALLILWVLPMRIDRMRGVYYACEVINAWAALDVFMVAIIACITEISQFAAFMVGDNCDAIDRILKRYLDKQLHGDDKCFDVVTELKRGAWLLFAAAFLSWFLSHFVLRCAHSAIEERIKRAEGDGEDEREEDETSLGVARRVDAGDAVYISMSSSSNSSLAAGVC